jgi:alanyl-tRNA synthetase
VGDLVEARVDRERRLASARNHTGTHLLHAALRQVMGAHVRQAGSLVTPDRLRLDFTSPIALTGEELGQVERLVNQKVREDLPVHKRETSYQAAVAQGALAFFGDKYADQVRVVEVANGVPFSLEVCGVTHLERTGEVGAFVIISESSIGSGMRRIEAATGHGAEALIRARLNTLQNVADLLQTTPTELEDRAKALLEELAQARRRAEALERQLARGSAETLLRQVKEVGGLKVLACRVEASTVEARREVGDWLRDKLGSGVVVLGAVFEGRPTLVAMVTPDLVSQGVHAGNIVREAAKVMDGSGGGRPNLAQAGGRRPEKLDDALAAVPGIVSAQRPR